MKRRDVIVLLALSAAPRLALAQPKTATIGVLVTGNRDPALFLNALASEMGKLGYSEGKNLRTIVPSRLHDASALPALAAGLVNERVDVIVTWLTPAVRAAKQATSTIPIVMAGAGDPVATGIVSSLAQPGGNITGVGSATSELVAKNIELLRELLPKARKLAALANEGDLFTATFVDQSKLAASRQGFELAVKTIRASGDLPSAFTELKDGGIEAVIVQPSLPVKRCAELAAAAGMPSTSPIESYVTDGGLLAYANRTADHYRLAATYVDRILRGTAPRDLPIQLPTNFELRFNLRTARAIGLTVQPALLARADDVIE
ncbi:ABC transporter substrate-binding protein [Bradyrhizobium sp.]|uniref:ABC transporter substrate-binding protein n=1 Tax=Bradyrhizobium sp. TaxID=376 RepID=UPI0039E5B5C3